MNMLSLQHHPSPNKPKLLASPKGVRAKGFCGDNLGFSVEGRCLTWSLSLWSPCRTSHSRAKAEAAVTAAQKAQEEARIARITAKEFSPSFQHRENGQYVPLCRPALWTWCSPHAALCPSQPCKDPKSPNTSPAQGLIRAHSSQSSLGNHPATAAFGGFSTRLSIFNTSSLCSPGITGIPSFHTKIP